MSRNVSSHWMRPAWMRRDRSIHLTYELPHRINVTQVYPIIAPNGSSIIIYGHEGGVTIVWRGGRPFRQAPTRTFRPKALAASTNSNELMIIDVDGDEGDPEQQQSSKQPEFEDEGVEEDPEEPYEHVVDVLEIPLDTDVLHIALPDVPPDTSTQSEYSMPKILGESIVFVVACTDASVRLLHLNTTPTRESTRSRALEDMMIVEPHASPLALSKGLSMTWTGRQQVGAKDDEESVPEWSFLIANHTCIGGGVLSVFQVSLSERGAVMRENSVSTLHEEYLHSTAGAMSFSSSHYPSRRHTQLLVTTTGSVRIYEPLPRTKYSHHERTSQGNWLASLHAPFETPAHSSLQDVHGGRSRILDAQWAFDGQCIVVLLADGQWGLWDIEGMGSSTSRSLKLSDAGTTGSGISGGGVTRFALRGFVGENAAALAAKLDPTGTVSTAKETKKLIPMTPNTRRVKQQALFTGPTSSSTISGLCRGGISLSSAPATVDGAASDEALVLWYENALYAMPSILTYWQGISNNEAFSGPNITRITALSASNENITNVCQPPYHIRSPVSTSLQHDIFIAAEHRLVMLCPTQSRRREEGEVRRLLGTQEVQQIGGTNDPGMDVDEEDVLRLDHDLLSKGQLDLRGLDRMLSGMGGAGATSDGGLFGAESRTRRVGFAAGF